MSPATSTTRRAPRFTQDALPLFAGTSRGRPAPKKYHELLAEFDERHFAGTLGPLEIVMDDSITGRCLGYCMFVDFDGVRYIRLQRPVIALSARACRSDALAADVLLHEALHAYVGQGVGHCGRFVTEATRIGSELGLPKVRRMTSWPMSARRIAAQRGADRMKVTR
jgi:hypothetical protein